MEIRPDLTADAARNDVAVRIHVLGGGRVPSYTRSEDAAVDLRSASALTIGPGHRLLVPTGIRLAIPTGFAGLVLPRSGLAINHGITVLNAPGLIDENYRGEIKVALHNTSDAAFSIKPGDRIAQLLVIPVPRIRFQEVEELDETERGCGGFGSSGL
ncbi:dUTP diphosphatase [Adlercreutzia aquisgranensis]|uniref:dUTP diphosphatase n=1 Tax=Adlercreutzia aquisgranensis TaxID=2941323 RepID=UPI002040CA90|nr:dUTP diphosphatase [Adlercreutzia aquisgranensis]